MRRAPGTGELIRDREAQGSYQPSGTWASGEASVPQAWAQATLEVEGPVLVFPYTRAAAHVEGGLRASSSRRSCNERYRFCEIGSLERHLLSLIRQSRLGWALVAIYVMVFVTAYVNAMSKRWHVSIRHLARHSGVAVHRDRWTAAAARPHVRGACARAVGTGAGGHLLRRAALLARRCDRARRASRVLRGTIGEGVSRRHVIVGRLAAQTATFYCMRAIVVRTLGDPDVLTLRLAPHAARRPRRGARPPRSRRRQFLGHRAASWHLRSAGPALDSGQRGRRSGRGAGRGCRPGAAGPPGRVLGAAHQRDLCGVRGHAREHALHRARRHRPPWPPRSRPRA